MERFFGELQETAILSSIYLAFIEHDISYEYAIDENNVLKLNDIFDNLDPVTNLNLINSIYSHYTNFKNNFKSLFVKPLQKSLRIAEQNLYLSIVKEFEIKIKH